MENFHLLLEFVETAFLRREKCPGLQVTPSPMFGNDATLSVAYQDLFHFNFTQKLQSVWLKCIKKNVRRDVAQVPKTQSRRCVKCFLLTFT